MGELELLIERINEEHPPKLPGLLNHRERCEEARIAYYPADSLVVLRLGVFRAALPDNADIGKVLGEYNDILNALAKATAHGERNRLEWLYLTCMARMGTLLANVMVEHREKPNKTALLMKNLKDVLAGVLDASLAQQER